MAAQSSALVFKVHRREPELVRPAKPTPYEVKLLSDIDDQEGLRFHIPVIQFYKHVPSMRGKDPVAVIRRALSEALVPYYPFAGRLREGPNRKLMVECTAEGVLFVEADADVRLAEFGDQLQPPFPCMKELLFDVPGSNAVLHSPLLLIQVTRLKCGSFIFALRLSHCMSDAPGLVQFMSAIGEIAQESHAPSIPPVWERHFLSARSPPRLTHTHREYEQQANNNNNNTLTTMPLNFDNMAQKSFFFGRSQLSALRRHAPPHLCHSYSRFEILASCLWKCRTVALRPHPQEKMRMVCLVSMRGKFSDPPLPIGYYGNTFAFAVAEALAGELCRNPLGYALDLVRKAKGEVTEEYMKSVADLMALKGRPNFLKTKWTYLVSDVTRAGFETVDFGWGAPVYGGPGKPDVGPNPGLTNFFIPCKNKEGEDGIVLAISLSVQAMERFAKELESMLKSPPVGDEAKTFTHVMSAL
ncbi:unnamed protein product [Linum tenue]|uniref:Benzyl alcohol O-benzoyltransferase n=1 Tax=Linum tenue TaxID=586396 RepID=A0AAV0PYV7_9ROSI|nr:unnamed protein product [Linum tenue]